MNCRPGHHRHHHGHHHHDRHRKRQQNLAWFGVVMLVVILAFCGIAAWSDHSHPIAPELPTAPVVGNPTFPDAPTFIEPPNDSPVEDLPPAISGGHRRNHHRHHYRRHDVVGIDRLYGCAPPTISGYDSDGSVISIPNPDFE